MKSIYQNLKEINVSKYVEKKQNLSYISWANALHLLFEKYPDATFEKHMFEGMPYLKTDLGYFVQTSVTIGDVTRTELMPVLDHRNRPIEKPNTFDINKSLQRCLAKTVALHGLGLSLYQGEDLVDNEKVSHGTPCKWIHGTNTMPFGSDKGKLIQDIPVKNLESAIQWMNGHNENGKFDELLNKLTEHIEARGK